ncbi:hypothetical protein AALP_AA8G322500 [Arabis alpina]|uniref:Uncharacterized protein n=1 Tax=Arabis alpina TaxID=50452 RepID=A0A087GAV6_ARAAL|nr:hypothetical protein AALP_AA8G322500 [Arabis alpina]
MGKSSSSTKKIKRSKDSSKLRSVNKKKSKRSKSKKIRRIKEYSDESESSGSDSSLYSTSSEDDYRSKKRGSKLTKKRSRKRYSSSESDDDDTRLLKKKNRSKRKDEHVGTKKKKKKVGSRKRRKRDTSSSSDSSSVRDSQSDDGSESDGKRRTRDRGRLGKVRRSKDGPEEDSEPDECWQVEDEVMTEKNSSRRLKSIVVVSYSYDKDEDMVDDDHDDVYLRHGGNSDSGDRELGRSEESDSDNGRKTVDYDEFEEDDTSEARKASHQDNRLKDDDLEAILKQRALENLKRFRGEAQKSGIARKEVSSVAKGESRQIESGRTEELQDHELMDVMEKKKMLRGSTGSRDFENSQNILHEVDNVSESGTVFPDIASQQSRDTVKVKISSGISSCSSKRKLIRPVLGQESSLNLVSGKEAAGCEDAEAESINGDTIDRNCPESSLALATKNGGENIESTKVSSTLNAQSSSHADIEALDEIRGESQSQPEQKTSGETKEESQYEQKTMTVMRGGEMVQVSYKVYIPKKTSSLGRRKLKR